MPKIRVRINEEIYTGPVSSGSYEGRCVDCKSVPKKNDPSVKQAQWKFSFHYAEADTEVTLTRWTPLAGRGVGFTRQILDGLDVPYETFGSGETKEIEFDSDDVIQKECYINVEQETDQNGRLRSVVDSVLVK